MKFYIKKTDWYYVVRIQCILLSSNSWIEKYPAVNVWFTHTFGTDKPAQAAGGGEAKV